MRHHREQDNRFIFYATAGTLITFATFAMYVEVAASAQTKDQPRPTSVTAQLSKASQIVKRERQTNDEFMQIVQSQAEHFTRVRYYKSDRSRETTFESVLLNQDAAGIDAIIFTIEPREGTPADEQRFEFSWEFVLPTPVGSFMWYIMPVEGQLEKGFTSFSNTDNVAHPDPEMPDANATYYQRLPTTIPPGSYILWFWFDDNKPHRLFYDLTVDPA
jgi:hypothetical protein